jgi:hypothetical protein
MMSPHGRRLAEIVALIVSPAVAFLALRMEPFFKQNGVDPFIYVGYTENAPDLILRFHYPYFAVRFGLLIPTQIASWLFGPLTGYFALRYFLALTAATSVYVLARALGSRWAGWFGVALVLTSPVFVRALLTIYSVTTGVPFLLAGLALFILPVARRVAAVRFAAGVAFAMAIHANPFVAAVELTLLAPLALLAIARRRYRELSSLLWVVAGGAAVTLLGMAYYGITYGDADIISPSVAAMRALARSAAFRAPDQRWVSYSSHLLIPIVALLLGVGAIATVGRVERRLSSNGWVSRWLRSPALDCVAPLAGAIAFYAPYQFLSGGAGLERHFYAAYLFAPAAVAAIGAVALLTTWRARLHQTRDERPAIVALITVAGLALVRSTMGLPFTIWVWPEGVLLAAAAACATIVAALRPSVLPAAMPFACAPLALLALCVPRGMPLAAGVDPMYADALGNPDRLGLEQYQVAASFTRLMPKWVDQPGSIVFWYRDDDATLNLVQSTFLWRPTSLMLWDRGLPTLSDRQVEMLRTRTPRFLVLLASDPSDLTLGTDELVAHGIVVRGIRDERISAGRIVVFVRTLELQPSSCDEQWRTFTSWLNLGPCGNR